MHKDIAFYCRVHMVIIFEAIRKKIIRILLILGSLLVEAGNIYTHIIAVSFAVIRV